MSSNKKQPAFKVETTNFFDILDEDAMKVKQPAPKVHAKPKQSAPKVEIVDIEHYVKCMDRRWSEL